MTARWEVDLKKGGGERCKEEEKSQGAGREIARWTERDKGNPGRQREKEREGQTLRERWTDRNQ